MSTGQVLFHRLFRKASFTRFSVKRVAATCIWLAGKLEESSREWQQVVRVFHRMECRREGIPVHHLDASSLEELMGDLIRIEKCILKEMGFVCHVEHPHKFIPTYAAVLGSPELVQVAWNLANDSLRTTLCVRLKSHAIACGVIFAASRRLRVPLPEDPPWWTLFDADEAGIQQVCRALAQLYSLPKAQYIPAYTDNDSFVVKRS